MSDKRFMHQALILAREALAAGEFPVGCLLVAEGRVVAHGSRTGSAGTAANEIDHAEMTALRRFYHRGAGHRCGELAAYCTLEPCLMCFGALLHAGVCRIVYAYEDAMGGGTRWPLDQLPGYYRRRRPVTVPHVLREQSLALFRTFFESPETAYLKNTALARYTLAQPLGPAPVSEGRHSSAPPHNTGRY